MTIRKIKTLLSSVDPHIRHYWSAETERDYTVWEETDLMSLMGDDRHIEKGWTFYVHRFTRQEDDAIAEALFSALDAEPEIAVHRAVDQEPDTGYIHHIYRCEGV